MPFPFVTEIIDAIVQYLIEPSHGTEEDEASDAVEDVRHFRLVCRDFAAVAFRHLLTTVSIARVPQAFRIADEVAKHPLARLYVRKFIIYYDNVSIKRRSGIHPSRFTIAAAYIDEFQRSGEDKRSIESSIRSFPQLKQVEFRSLQRETANCQWHEFAMKLYDKLGFDYILSPNSKPDISVLNQMRGSIDNLILSKVFYSRLIYEAPMCFQYLKTLKISSSSLYSTSITTGFHELPKLEELHYIGVAFRDEKLTGLPVSLRILHLEHINLSQEPLPSNLHTLVLKNVLFDSSTMPSALSRIRFENLHVLDTSPSSLQDIFLKLSTGCTFNIAGYIAKCARTDNNRAWYNPEDSLEILCYTDKVLDTLLGEVISNILCANQVNREELLEQLFSKFDHPRMYENSSRVVISADLKAKYQHMAQNLPRPCFAIEGPFWCGSCGRRHGKAWTGSLG